MKDFINNKFRRPEPAWDRSLTGEFESSDIIKVHRSLGEYSPTPLLRLSNLAGSLGLRQILVKDEAHRFGLKAFKALGASYAIYRFICDEFKKSNLDPPAPDSFYSENDIIPPEKYTFCTATDGNHGRGVAWTASKLEQKAVIYMPKNTVPARIENIRKLGAEVHVVAGDYDDAVGICQEEAERNGWQIISDTSWPGYETIPAWIMAGYVTIFQEIDQSLSDSEKIDCFIIQGGVGALAAAASWYYNTTRKAGDMKIVSIEPREAACLLESIDTEKGEPLKSRGNLDSIMAGLNCGTPSLAAWPFIKQGIDLFMTVSDSDAVDAMRSYYYPQGDDPQIISGESGASSLAALKALCEKTDYKDAREFLALKETSTVLLLNTEGDTDPEFFRKTV